MWERFRGKVVGSLAAVMLLLGWGSTARAEAIVTHIYELNGSFADSLGGPSLVPNGGVLGATGYTFGFGQGPSVSNAINPTTYSIEMLFSINQTDGFRKLIDFKNLTSDNGLYNLDTALNFFPVTTGPSGSFTAGATAHLVVTRDGSTNQFIGYVNGVQRISFTDTFNDAGVTHVPLNRFCI